MNLGDKSLAYLLAVLVQQRWSSARLILSFVAVIISSIWTFIMGAGIDIEKQRFKPVDISTVSANSLGGRYNEVYGMTSMSLLLNASKGHWPIGPGTHGYYQGEILSEQMVHTLVPKIPEMGMYIKETGHPSSRSETVTKAKVHKLDGLSYSCKYSVEEKSTPPWTELETNAPDRVEDAEDILKVLGNEVKSSDNNKRSSFVFRLAFKRGRDIYAQLEMNCSIELVEGEFCMSTELDGVALMKYSKIRRTKRRLPKGLIGEKNTTLGAQLAFSAGWSSTVNMHSYE